MNKSVLGTWLRELREASGMSKGEAGQAIGADSRELRRWEQGEAPGGINLLRLLNTYGVKFSQAPPGAIPGAVNTELHDLREEVDSHLAALEAKVEAQGEAMTKALKALTAGIRRIERRLDAEDPPASQSSAR